MTSVVVSAIPLAAGAVAAVPLARGAAVRWRGQRAGRAYELAVDYRPAVLRAVACAAVLVTGIVLALTLPGDLGEPAVPQAAARPSAVPRAAPAPPPPSRPHPRARTSPSDPSDPSDPSVSSAPSDPSGRSGSSSPSGLAGPSAPSGSSATTPTPVPDTPPLTEGRPEGGTLQRFADGTRVWLPPQYTYASAARRTFPLVVAYVPDTGPDREQLFAAFARSVVAGKADPFVVVLPPDCTADPERAAALADRNYRTVSGVRARGVLGVGAFAPCAVREALFRPGRFGAYTGVAGAYGPAAPALPSAAPVPSPDLALTVGALEAPQHASALRLSTALRGLGVRPRLVDGVIGDRHLGGGQRRCELALAAQYFTEELTAPGGVAHVGTHVGTGTGTGIGQDDDRPRTTKP